MYVCMYHCTYKDIYILAVSIDLSYDNKIKTKKKTFLTIKCMTVKRALKLFHVEK